MQTLSHYPSELEVAMRYLSKPWVHGGRGPYAFDCYGLCIDVYQNALGIDCRHDFEGFDTSGMESSRWKRVTAPSSFSVVLMSVQGQSHAGIWLDADRGGVLHCVCNYGVIFTPRAKLTDIGIRIESFYDYIH